MATFAVVHNIPSPYRLHLFAALEQDLHKRGHDFVVHFFAHGHQDRPDSWQNPDIPFPHKFWRDYGFSFRNVDLHFNPGLIGHLLKNPPDYLLVGGPWDTPTGFLASLINRNRVRIAWMEGNTFTPGRITGPIGFYKRCILSLYNYMAVPGVEGANYIKLLYGNQGMQLKNIVVFPNLVDECLFTPKTAPLSEQKNEMLNLLGIRSDEKLAVWPARLTQVKGIVKFLKNIRAELLVNWKIVIIGEGPLKNEISDVIKQRNMAERVIIRNYIEYQKMPELYSSADLFMLASLYDPNPLSVVEAMHSGLPLLLSNRVGNFPEALKEGINGWGFDPSNVVSILKATENAFTATADQLAEMGRKSVERVRIYWDTEKSICAFLDTVLK